MRRLSPALVLLVLMLVVHSATAYVPQTMSYQGVLRHGDGSVVPNGLYSVTFRIYDVAVGGSEIWMEPRAVEVDDGIFNVTLGTVTPLTIPFDTQYWLGVSIEEDPELAPRTELTSSPYAFRAQFAETGSDEDWTISGDDIYRLAGSVGIGGAPTLSDPESKDGEDTRPRLDRNAMKLYIFSELSYASRSELYEPDAAIDGRAAVYGYRSRSVRNDGTGYGEATTNNAVTGYNFWGDNYTFGVGGFTYGDYGISGGVLGASQNGATWGSLGYRDAGMNWWGLYTPYNAYVGGFVMPTGAAAGEVLTCDASGVASWQPATGGIGGGGAANYIPKFTGASTLGNSILYDEGTYVSMIGDLYVSGLGSFGGIVETSAHGERAGSFITDYGSTSTHAVHGEYTGSVNVDAIAVYGKSAPSDYYGVGGQFVGGFVGAKGEVYPTGSSAYSAIQGIVVGGDGTNYALYGSASGDGTNYGVYASAAGTGANYAGYFSGAVHVSGTLSKAAGSFKIDHPLDPENKYLCHSFVESPDMMNVYNGNVVLDANGEARVELPEWFEAVNADFRYQLTCIGGFAPVYVSEEISGNAFGIAGGEPGMKISWQVTGIRHDPYAEAHRIQVEEDKPDRERGKYLHPDLYGQPETESVSHVKLKTASEPSGE